MLHRLTGATLALALLLPAAGVAAPAHAAPDERARATTKTRHVHLGHKPVRVDTSTRLRLVFHARRGTLVNLARWNTDTDGSRPCGRVSLKLRGGKTVKEWAPGYWRLPRKGTYVALAKPCNTQDLTTRVQIRTVVRHDPAVAGVETRIGKRSSVTHLVPVFVGRRERVDLTPSAAVEVITPERRITRGQDLVLADRGRHWVEMTARSTLATARTIEHVADVDGARVGLARTGADDTTHEVTFAGQAGQWVYLELLDASGQVASDTGRDVRIHRADGVEVETVLLHRCRPRRISSCTTTGPWLLPSTGTYRMTLDPDSPETEQATTLRIRAAVVAPDLTVDGPAVTYQATSPGQWVVGAYPSLPERFEATDSPDVLRSLGTQVEVDAANITPSLGGWTFTLAPRFPFSLSCDEQRDGVGCDEYARVSFGPGDPTLPSTPLVMPPDDTAPGVHDSYAVLVVPPGGVGSIDVSLTDTADAP